MKSKLFLSVAFALLLVGCGDSSSRSTSDSTNTPASGSVVTAPVDYLNSAAKAQQSAVKTVDVTSVNKAIEMFNVQEGQFPKDLNELVIKKYMPQIPTPPIGSKLEYDSSAGTVKVVKQ